MDYSRAIRVARSLADISQNELAKRISLDPSLVSMLESGRRKPSLQTLEKIAEVLDIPFHLFTLLASEPSDLKDADPAAVHRLAEGLSKLLLSGGQDEVGGKCSSRPKAERSERKPPRSDTRSSQRKAV